MGTNRARESTEHSFSTSSHLKGLDKPFWKRRYQLVALRPTWSSLECFL